jgi:hypothetical protein
VCRASRSRAMRSISVVILTLAEAALPGAALDP